MSECLVCGGRVKSKLGICTLNTKCKAEWHRKNRRVNQERYSGVQAEYRAREAASIKEYNVAYTAANAERISEYQRQYRLNNPEKRAATVASWAKRNLDSARRAELERRSRKLQQFVATVDLEELYLSSNGMCHLCLKPVAGEWHADHVIALRAGGTHEPDNMAVAHSSCNQSKGKRSGSRIETISERALNAYWKFHGVQFDGEMLQW